MPSVTEAADQRQLLAIMFTDVVGYTALTERDESAAVRVREQHRELVQTLVRQFDGEVVDATGDESFSVFPSALRAVDCALALQGALRSYPDLRVRIGIHLGDVLRHEGEVVGDGVNVAARVRPLAEPGGIAISEPVYQMVRTRAHVSSRSLGVQRFKNVETPVEVYALDPAETEPAAPAARARRRWIPALAALALLLLGIGLYAPARTSVMTALILHIPPLLGASIEQEIGFARNPDDGVRIAYATTGEGDPVIISFLGWATHVQEGIGSTMYDPDDLVRISSRRNRFVRFDGRGFGLSDRGITEFSLDTRVADLAAVIDALGVEQVALHAYSSSGTTAIAFTARYPERVSRLALGGTFATGRWRGDRAELDQRIRPLIIENWDDPSVRNLVVDRLVLDEDPVMRRVLNEFLRRSCDGPGIAGFFLDLWTHDVEELARQISVPTLVMHGRDDRVVPPEEGRNLASLIPGARFELVEGGHREGIGAAAATRIRIIDFLNGDETR
jgi:class 3 adenylate cyclase/pimeloyl-ACP methyl ester carboxylesterase